jgi:integrase
MRVNGLYFPNKYGAPFSAWSVWDKRFRKDVGFSDFCLHDLRRTLATNMQRLGVRIEVTEKILAHSHVTGGLVGVYQKYDYLREMADAISLYEEHVTQLGTPTVHQVAL